MVPLNQSGRAWWVLQPCMAGAACGGGRSIPWEMLEHLVGGAAAPCIPAFSRGRVLEQPLLMKEKAKGKEFP